jgi:protein-S-isoprenylcysteine O-methyltransferase Ste14
MARFYIKPLYFDIINLAFVNLVFFLFYREATTGLLMLRAAIGTPIVLLSFYFESISHRVFQNAHRRPEEIRKLVTGGIYSEVRHPIYLGRMLLNIGFLIMFPIIPMLAVAIIFVIVWFLMALSEEMFLMKKFGKSYKKYKEKVPMFIPQK